MGEGFTWETQDRARDIAAARQAWQAVLQLMADESYQMVIADELNIVLRYGYLPLDVGHGLWGGYGEYIHLHERTILHKLPDSLPLELATIYQALASGIRWAVDVPETRFSDTVLVLGFDSMVHA